MILLLLLLLLVLLLPLPLLLGLAGAGGDGKEKEARTMYFLQHCRQIRKERKGREGDSKEKGRETSQESLRLCKPTCTGVPIQAQLNCDSPPWRAPAPGRRPGGPLTQPRARHLPKASSMGFRANTHIHLWCSLGTPPFFPRGHLRTHGM